MDLKLNSKIREQISVHHKPAQTITADGQRHWLAKGKIIGEYHSEYNKVTATMAKTGNQARRLREDNTPHLPTTHVEIGIRVSEKSVQEPSWHFLVKLRRNVTLD